MGLATYTVWFTEKTVYRVDVQATSPLEAARLVNREWNDEGVNDLEPEGTEVGDFSVYDITHKGYDIDDEEVFE